MNIRTLRRGTLLAALVVAGSALAPVAFAHSSVSIGLGFYGPGYSVGVGDCINCGYYRRVYYPAYYPAYYAPAPVYYDPYPVYYYPRPVYYGGYYYHRHWQDRDDWRWHDHDDWDDHDGHGWRGRDHDDHD